MSEHYENDEVEALRQRLQQLEVIVLEHMNVEHLLDYAAEGRDLTQYTHYGAPGTVIRLGSQLDRLSTVNSLLYVDPATGRIRDANDAALKLIGYTHEELLTMTIGEIEMLGRAATGDLRTYVETSIEEEVYQALYRHRSGEELLVQVYKRLLYKGDQAILHYRLEDKSILRRLWYELIRREQGSFAFQQRLQVITKVTIELSRIKDFDVLCRYAVQCAIERLGFDRIGIWFLDHTRKTMIGTYGVDESGRIRDEHGQNWSYKDTYVSEFLSGDTQSVFAYDESPIYNDRSQIIGYGWHLAAPMLHEGQVIGVMMVDNYLRKQPVNDYDRELLRLYAITVGELAGDGWKNLI